MRRPLRFLSHKLGLTSDQVATLAEVLADLRTERAARDVEHQRAQKLYADALKADTFDAEAAKRARDQVVAAHIAQQAAITTALERLHAELSADQRAQLSAILRTDAFLF